MKQINRILTKMGICKPVCSLIRSKNGISVYRIESESKKLILKVFNKQEDAREIKNYLILSQLGIQTLPLLNYTEDAILLPDIESNTEYRLGTEDDLKNTQTAKAIAKWYKELHTKGSIYLSGQNSPMYDETDVLTLDNIDFIAERTNTKNNNLWKAVSDIYDIIRRRIDALPRTLTYNDFYYTNLIVSKNLHSAFMFDYNLLGKGMAYGDIRNVTSSLSQRAAEVFKSEYGIGGFEKQAKADAFIAPLVSLYSACKHEVFPSWAAVSLEDLKNGNILRYLNSWINDFV